MAKKFNEINLNSEEKDIRDFLDEATSNTIYTDAPQLPRRSLEIQYCLDILRIKQQKQLLDDQNEASKKILESQNTFNRDTIKINKKLVYATWTAVAVSLLALFVGSYYQSRNTQTDENRTSFDLMLRIEQDLGSKTNQSISSLVEDNKPVLKKNGGKFDEVDLDKFLGEYESLGDFYTRSLVPATLVCSWFGDGFASIFSNKEVFGYIQSQQKLDPSYFDKITILNTKLGVIQCAKAK